MDLKSSKKILEFSGFFFGFFGFFWVNNPSELADSVVTWTTLPFKIQWIFAWNVWNGRWSKWHVTRSNSIETNVLRLCCGFVRILANRDWRMSEFWSRWQSATFLSIPKFNSINSMSLTLNSTLLHLSWWWSRWAGSSNWRLLEEWNANFPLVSMVAMEVFLCSDIWLKWTIDLIF